MKQVMGAIGVLLAVAFAGCGGEPGEIPLSGEPVDVEVSTAVASSAVKAVPATVVAMEEAELATRISGTIRRMSVRIGAPVVAGQALAALDTDEIDARIASAEAAAELASQWHQRIASLSADGAATAQELDDADARLEMAEAGLRDARAQKDYVVLRAPFAGVITGRMADPGDLAVPGIPILTMIGSGGLKVEADLPAELARRLAVGTKAAVYWAETGERYPTIVARLVPAVERSSRRFRVEAQFDSTSPDIPPGTFVRLELGEPTATTRWIPADAVMIRGQLKGVFVVEADQLRLRWVRLGQQLDGAVELLAGPTAEELLVRKPAVEFIDGQPVKSVREVDWAPPIQVEPRARAEGGR